MTDSMLNKIQALLAKAESTDSDHEREALIEKAEQLMVKYAIDEAVLDAARAKAGGVRETPVRVVFTYSGSEANKPGKVSLLSGLCRAHGVKVVYQTGGPKYRGVKREQHAYLVGFQTDIDFTQLLYVSLVLQGEAAASRAYRETGGDGYSTRYVWCRTFFDGFVAEVVSRVKAARERATAHETRDAAPGTALVLVDRSKAVDAYHAELFPRLGKMRSGGRSSAWGAGSAGRAAGAKADISGGRGHLGGRKALS